MKQFMRHLYDAKVLVFEPASGWGWDLRQIERLECTDNVLSLMTETLRRLPQATQRVLRLASAIRNTFELDVLNTVSERAPEETYASLDHALGEGLIVSANEQFRFAHDKIQEAAYSLIPERDRPAPLPDRAALARQAALRRGARPVRRRQSPEQRGRADPRPAGAHRIDQAQPPGRRASRGVGGHKIQWSASTPPESQAITQRAVDELRSTGQFQPFEKEFFRKDGSRVPVLLGGARFEGSEAQGVAFVLDVSERKQAEERQRLLLNELNHRVKNTLAIVQAIAVQTLRMADSPGAFTDAFLARLLALSQTHNLLNETSWQGAGLRDIVCAELAPHADCDAERVRVTGEDVRLRPEVAVTLGMAFHELATNAAKYGALSQPSGRVAVTWNVSAQGHEPLLCLKWQETNGPPVRPPRRRGFGSRLIERDLQRQLATDVRLDFLPEGVRCVMYLPLERVIAG
ncbi:HWE histidine kinase domain-containing protein [Sorangium sp. So ce590]|uniref:sensor histidine kinase n=1 Tax=Sorangium sp. So ce590 TaxID=3133317 RepID=UPI003F62B897